ncbi:hypothetical protein [Rhodococcus jostii]|uniref:hypothetical protein n=1 Tax=Rhodococcus jostii TaxID=132919 RepID=UPI00362E5ECB
MTINDPQPLTHDDVRAIVREELAELGDLLSVIPGLKADDLGGSKKSSATGAEFRFAVSTMEEALRRVRAAEAKAGEPDER